MKRIGVLTTGRQDWGILRSTCLALREDRSCELILLVGGMHLDEAFGMTVRGIEREGFVPAARIGWADGAAADQAGRALAGVAASLRELRPEGLLLVGDRFETAAAAVAGVLERVALVHLHGGEETEGAFDNSLRHAISKMSHLHLVSHADHAARLIAMGESPASVRVVGAPGLDNALRVDLPDRAAIERAIGGPLEPPLVVVTLHPATLGERPEEAARALVDAMDRVPATYLITLPNADPGAATIRGQLRATGDRPRRYVVEALGESLYWGILRIAAALLGNSSSALIEAPLLQLPAVNVGARQAGRLRGKNVIDAPSDGAAIAAALRAALEPAFRARLAGTTSPYGDGRSGPRIVQELHAFAPPSPLRKPGVAPR